MGGWKWRECSSRGAGEIDRVGFGEVGNISQKKCWWQWKCCLLEGRLGSAERGGAAVSVIGGG